MNKVEAFETLSEKYDILNKLINSVSYTKDELDLMRRAAQLTGEACYDLAAEIFAQRQISEYKMMVDKAKQYNTGKPH